MTLGKSPSAAAPKDELCLSRELPAGALLGKLPPRVPELVSVSLLACLRTTVSLHGVGLISHL